MPDQADRLRQLAARRRLAEDTAGPPRLGGREPAPSRARSDEGGAHRRVHPGRVDTPIRPPHGPITDTFGPHLAAEGRPVALADTRPVAPRARTIAVTSGKGGVGKTCVTVNLALALAERGRRVVIVDLDLGLANIDVVTDVRSRHNLYHVLVGRKSLREVVVSGPGGILIVPGASGISQLADLADARRRDLIARLAELETLADVILIDTAAGIGRNVIGFAQAADEVLVVTTPEPTAVTDAYATIKTICRAPEHGELNLLVNMAANAIEARQVSRRIVQVARQFLSVYVEEVGHIVTDPHMREAVRVRQPLLLAFPKAPASACLQCVAQVLGHEPTRPLKRAGFFARLVETLAGHHPHGRAAG